MGVLQGINAAIPVWEFYVAIPLDVHKNSLELLILGVLI